MLVIHISHVFAKLSTLKRSRLEVISALKHSRLCAETLPLSIYTYSYLYKRTCSWQQQVVNNLFLKRFLSSLTIAFITILATACSSMSPAEKAQETALHLSQPPYNHFEQVEGNEVHPAAYFTCSGWKNPYHKSSKVCLKKITKSHAIKDKSDSISHLSSGGK
jgi:hypothetical protein